MEFRRHITFCRTYMDHSGMPEWPRGSRRAVSFRFDTFVTERDFVMHMMHNPAEFTPYFEAPPLHVRHVVTAPTLRGTRPYDAIEFFRWVSSNDPDHASIRSEWRNDDLGALTRSLIVDGAFRVGATFPVYDDASIANFCRWIVERRFNGFVHKDATVLFSAYAVPPHPDDVPETTNDHRGITYRPPHPLARSISNPFVVAAENNNAARPASPAGTVADVSDAELSEPEPDDAESVSEQEGGANSDSDLEEAEEEAEAPIVPAPELQVVDDPEANSFPQRALRRISDELFEVRQEMPEAVYVRLSNSLKRRLGE